MRCRLPCLLDDVRVARTSVVCDILVTCRAAIQSNRQAGSQEMGAQSADQAFACLHSHQLHRSTEQEQADVPIALHHPDLWGPTEQPQGGGLVETTAHELRYCNLHSQVYVILNRPDDGRLPAENI
jgi:hypothetical protein